MSDIFKDMQANVGCDYISNLPSYKRKQSVSPVILLSVVLHSEPYPQSVKCEVF